MSFRQNQTYIALDLELDQGDIIEVGVVAGSFETPKDKWVRKSWLVIPKGERPISQRITELTGITQELIDTSGICHNLLRAELEEFVKDQGAFVNPVQWGLGDAQELLEELDDTTGSKPPIFGRRVIDVKHFYLFIEAANGRALSGGLRSSMAKHGLEFAGTPHRASDDAFNTLRFFFHLLKRQSILEDSRVQLSSLKR